MARTAIRTALLAAILVGATSTACSGAPEGVCITADLGLDGVKPGDCLDRDDLVGLLDRPVRQGGNGAQTLELTHPEDFARREPVRTCREFFELKSGDYYAMSGTDMAAEGWYQRTCGTVRTLMKAERARRTFLNRPDSGFSDLSAVTVRILPVAAEASREELLSLSRAGMTIADFVAEGEVEVHSATKTELDLTYGSSRARYHELARGDLDSDGLEDVLIFMGVRAEGGTMKWYETIALTRKRPRGLMELVSMDGPEIN